MLGKAALRFHKFSLCREALMKISVRSWKRLGFDIETWYNVQIVKADKATHGLHLNEVVDFHDRKQ